MYSHTDVRKHCTTWSVVSGEFGIKPSSFRMTSRALYSAQYYRQHCTLQAFQQFGALYMHNPDDKYLTRPGYGPSTSEFQATTGPNEPSPCECCMLSEVRVSGSGVRVSGCESWNHVPQGALLHPGSSHRLSIILLITTIVVFSLLYLSIKSLILGAKCVLTLSSLNLPVSSSSTTSRELLSQFSTCSGWRWFDVG